MKQFKYVLVFAAVLSLMVAIFQALIGFSPSISIYFGAPETVTMNDRMLIVVSLLIAGIIALFGLYAVSGAGYIRTLPWLRHMLAAICCIYILRGIMFVPELLIVTGVLNSSMPVAPRFIVFSLVSLFIGLTYLTGTIGGWHSFPSNEK